MIDATRALLEQTDRELARLTALRASLLAFIDQPGSGEGALEASRSAAGAWEGSIPSAAVSPAPVSHAEAVRNGSRTSVDQAEERGFNSRPPLHLTCQHCSKEFAQRRGVATHEKWCEQNPDRAEPWHPKPEGTGLPPQPLRAARETFLCDRCQDPFPSRQALAEHRRSHPEIPPAAGPMRRAGGLTAFEGIS